MVIVIKLRAADAGTESFSKVEGGLKYSGQELDYYRALNHIHIPAIRHKHRRILFPKF